MVIVKCKIKPYIQPFEKILAIRELTSLSGSAPSLAKNESGGGEYYVVKTNGGENFLASKLSYWELVQNATTTQVLREATVNVVRNSVSPEQIASQLPFNDSAPLPNRRILRYGSHGIHEYRGKFFPQLVRALINISKTTDKGIVADPMCGSGTTILEGVLSGQTAIGIDLNPLSTFMSRTKVEILKITPDELNREYRKIHDALLRSKPSDKSSGLKYFNSLSEHDQRYLSLWFAEHVLLDLDEIKQRIDRVENPNIRDFMLVALSNILRTVSYQKESDLRVRKEMKVDTDLDAIREFLEELGRSVRIVLAFLYQNHKSRLGTYRIFEGSALDIPVHWKKYLGKVDVIITSPPYATALPYLDTDRLSLSYLGLLSRSDQAEQNLEMIGNREITDGVRKKLWTTYEENKETIPASIVKIVDLIERLNKNSDVGFRRKNLSALLGKYFLDMKSVFEGMYLSLKPGSHAYVVVGNNHTIAGGKRVEIETAALLSDLAESVGFTPLENLPMEMLVSRDIFKKNAVASEYILDVQKPK